MTTVARKVSSIDLFWLPLGAGGHSVRWNGTVYEAVVALAGRRPALDLFHSALEVRVPEGRFVIEMTPIPDSSGAQRGVVGEGPVGSRLAGRFRLFRYELRCWRDGVIPDVREAVHSPVRLSEDEKDARRLLALVPTVPTLVWGRDELRAGEMWNSNSVVSWLITRTGLGFDSIQPPPGGRAPGWDAGHVIALRTTPDQRLRTTWRDSRSRGPHRRASFVRWPRTRHPRSPRLPPHPPRPRPASRCEHLRRVARAPSL